MRSSCSSSTLRTSSAWHAPHVCSATRRSPGLTNWMNSADSSSAAIPARCRIGRRSVQMSSARLRRAPARLDLVELRRALRERAGRARRRRVAAVAIGAASAHAVPACIDGASGLWQVRQPALLLDRRRPAAAVAASPAAACAGRRAAGGARWRVRARRCQPSASERTRSDRQRAAHDGRLVDRVHARSRVVLRESTVNTSASGRRTANTASLSSGSA